MTRSDPGFPRKSTAQVEIAVSPVKAPPADGCRSIRMLWEEVAATLARDGVPRPRDEARDMIAAVLGQPRFYPLLRIDTPLGDDDIESVRRAARQRGRGAPFAYAVGTAPFRHLTLSVDERVLIPRQETELLVDLVLAARRDRGGVVADIGTGSGAIALALATEGRFDRVIATDVDQGAVEIALENLDRVRPALRAPVEFRLGSGLAPLEGATVDVLVSNPPYIAFAEGSELPAGVRDWEPVHSLLCGDDGLAVTADVVRNGPARLNPGGLIALECDSRRVGAVATMLAASGTFRDVSVHRDYTGRDRFALATRA